MTLDGIQNLIQRTALKAYTEKLVAGTSGNVSVYDRERNIMAITPSGIDYTELKSEDVVLMHLDGSIVRGRFKPSSEWRLHAAIYSEMNHVNSVIHTHSPCATGFAVAHKEIPLILVEMLPFLGGDIPVAEFGLPGTDAVGVNAVKAMIKHPRNAALLANHGVVAVGANIEQAYIRAVYVEDAAKIYSNALQVGNATLIPSEAEVVLRERYKLSAK